MSEYLDDEVFSPLRPRLRQFAVRTSILDELDGQACAAVLGRPGSAALLAELARTSPSLAPVDSSHLRYRWHPLVREALLGRAAKGATRAGAGAPAPRR